ncbi:hypothetical protein FB45DRAFT_1112775 [Roridomyces roridus]|uniref:Uncharacterized protein n=1 Tax=Roridomyces roridus TaxID=1738132 RepID=A0AAD7B8I0_9AGAR|nr:hypothetical protein FB45DRAFT_1112775 [Roridomyces roridus]
MPPEQNPQPNLAVIVEAQALKVGALIGVVVLILTQIRTTRPCKPSGSRSSTPVQLDIVDEDGYNAVQKHCHGRVPVRCRPLAIILASIPTSTTCKLEDAVRQHDINVVMEGLFCLRQTARLTLGAQLIMDTTALEHVVVELLDSPHLSVRYDSCRLIAELARHQTVFPKVLAANPLPKIVQLLRQTDHWGQVAVGASEALTTLCQIARWKLGVDAIFKTPGALDTISKLELVKDSAMSATQAELLRILAVHRLEWARIRDNTELTRRLLAMENGVN